MPELFVYFFLSGLVGNIFIAILLGLAGKNPSEKQKAYFMGLVGSVLLYDFFYSIGYSAASMISRTIFNLPGKLLRWVLGNSRVSLPGTKIIQR